MKFLKAFIYWVFLIPSLCLAAFALVGAAAIWELNSKGEALAFAVLTIPAIALLLIGFKTAPSKPAGYNKSNAKLPIPNGNQTGAASMAYLLPPAAVLLYSVFSYFFGQTGTCAAIIKNNVSTFGSVTALKCNGRNRSLHYNFLVNGATYKGSSRAHTECSVLKVGSPVSISYLASDPSKNTKGDANECFRAGRYSTFFSFLILFPLSVIASVVFRRLSLAQQGVAPGKTAFASLRRFFR